MSARLVLKPLIMVIELSKSKRQERQQVCEELNLFSLQRALHFRKNLFGDWVSQLSRLLAIKVPNDFVDL